MKQCPVCRTAYADNSLSFCLEDGTRLVDVTDEEPTVVRPPEREALRVDAPSNTNPPLPVNAAASPAKSTLWLKLLIAAVVLGIGAIAVAGLAGAAFYYSTGSVTPTPTPIPPTPRPSLSKTPDSDKKRLEDEIANIQRQLEDQKKNAGTPEKGDEDQLGSPVTATVDSPNDGFLALRDRPDAERGVRLAKVPHGAEVELLNCEKTAFIISGRTGRWCQIEYNGTNGWVFDAWLEY